MFDKCKRQCYTSSLLLLMLKARLYIIQSCITDVKGKDIQSALDDVKVKIIHDSHHFLADVKARSFSMFFMMLKARSFSLFLLKSKAVLYIIQSCSIDVTDVKGKVIWSFLADVKVQVIHHSICYC